MMINAVADLIGGNGPAVHEAGGSMHALAPSKPVLSVVMNKIE